MKAQEKPVIVIVGPTASGKSDLAQEVARRTRGIVLSADSMQVYRGMDIGTGKVMPDEMAVPHVGLDLVEPGQPYSAALFQAYGRGVIDDALSFGKQVVVCGGTGLYVRALIDDFRFPAGEQVGNGIRDRYSRFLACHGAHALWEELRRVDPASAEDVHENDTKRVIRALELLSEGTSYHEQRQAFAHIDQLYAARFFGLAVDPAILNRRIDRRVDAMVQWGLVHEVESLLARGLREALTASQAIGYKEIVAYLEGRCTLEQAIEQVKVSTHRYAKRQRTWFCKDGRIAWLDANEFNAHALTDQVLGAYGRQTGGGGLPCR